MKDRSGLTLKLGMLLACAAALAPATTVAIANSGGPTASRGVVSKPTLPADGLKKLPYAPGRLIVKMKPSVKCVDCRINAGEGIGSRRLDKLNRLYGLRGARALNPMYRRLHSTRKRRANERRMLRRAAHRKTRRAHRKVKISEAKLMSSTYVLKFSPWLDMNKVAAQYERDPQVVYAEPDRKAKATNYTPNDTYFASSGAWGQSFGDLWGVHKVQAPAAWDTTKGEGVVVAVSDTGVDFDHVDLRDRRLNPQWNQFWSNPGEGTYGNGRDDDHNGYIDDIHGYDFVAHDGDPTDYNGHGTHVAGTIAAAGDNGQGIVGVAFKSKIMAVRGLDANGSGYISDLADGISYAALNGADVINASWGGIGQSDTLDDAIDQATAAGTTFVAAAGNNNADVEHNAYGGPFYPAASPNAIAVAATDHNDQKAYFSNYGARIDVAAPGGGEDQPDDVDNPQYSILSLDAEHSQWPTSWKVGPNPQYSDYVRLAGTSMATPHAVGVAALILSVHPNYSPAQVRQALRVGADDIGDPGFDTKYGYGRVNAARSIGLEVPNVALTSPETGYTTSGDQIEIDGTASAATGIPTSFQSYTVEYGSGDNPSSWQTIAGPITSQVDNGQLANWNTTNVPEGKYTVRVRVRNSAGTDFNATTDVTIDRTSLTAPEPRSIRRDSGSVEVRGTTRGADLESFEVQWRKTTPDYQTGPWSSAGVTTTGGGNAAVEDGLLGTIATAQFGGAANLDVRVLAHRTGDDTSAEALGVIVDSTLRTGWPKKIPGLPSPDAPGILPALTSSIMHHSTIADLDQNGTKEILVAYGDMVYVFRHDGSLLPGWPQIMDPAGDEPAFARQSPAAADLDNDGKLEVVTSNAFPAYHWTGEGNTYVWHDDGTPLAGWPKNISYQHNSYGYGNFNSGPRGDFELADVDNDGYRDIVAVVGPKLVVLDRHGDPLPGWPIGNEGLIDIGINDLVAVGDTDGDGTKEIAVVGMKPGNAKASQLALYSSTGVKRPGFPRSIPGFAYGIPHYRYTGLTAGPVMADFNGDGKLDITVMTGRLQMYTVDGKGARIKLGPTNGKGTANRACGKTIPATLEQAVAADLNGDGTAEVLAGSHVTSWRWKQWYGGPILDAWCAADTTGPDYINAFGTKKFAGWPLKIDFPSGNNTAGPGSPAVGDIDGDLQPDVVSASGICGYWDRSLGPNGRRCFTVSAWNAQGQMLTGFPKATPSGAPTAGMSPAIGDLDGDGRKEITTVDGDGNLMVWDVPGPSAPEKMQWPMFRGNAAHTGVLTPSP